MNKLFIVLWAAVFIVISFSLGVHTGLSVHSKNDKKVSRAIAKCQKDLPRNKVCVAEITAKVKE
jgi:hypothetical protein